MTDIQIVLPLSVVQGASSLTAEGIVEFLSNAVTVRQELDQTKTMYNDLVDIVNSAGANLTLILDEVEGMEKYRALRRFADEMKGLKRGKLK